MGETKRVKVEGPRLRTVLVIVGGLLLVVVAISGTVAYNRYLDTKQRDQAIKESQAQDYALCVIQNENRAGTRLNSLVTFNLVTAVLLAGGPENPQTKQVFRRQLRELTQQLKALRPIDCTTYVRPVPPDSGVESVTESG